MAHMRRKVWLVVLAPVVLLAGAFISSARLVIWAPAPVVRARLLLATPRGDSKGDVLNYLAAKGYSIAESGGREKRRVHGYPIAGSFADYVTADLGYYWLGWRVDVQAIYTFDTDERMKNVVIKRFVDAP